MRRPSLAPRPQRSVPAVLVGLVLLALAVLAIWTSVQRLAVGTWPAWWSSLTGVAGAHWQDAVVIAVAAVVCLVGVVLLLSAVLPGVRSALPLGGSDERHEVVVTRSGLARLVTTSAAQVSGVDAVRTSVGARQVGVRVTTPSSDTDDVRRRVGQDVAARLATLGLDPAPRVAVTARTTEGSGR